MNRKLGKTYQHNVNVFLAYLYIRFNNVHVLFYSLSLISSGKSIPSLLTTKGNKLFKHLKYSVYSLLTILSQTLFCSVTHQFSIQGVQPTDRHVKHITQVIDDFLKAMGSLLVDQDHVLIVRFAVFAHNDPLTVDPVVQGSGVRLWGLIGVRVGVRPGLIASRRRRPAVLAADVVPQREAVRSPATWRLSAAPFRHLPVVSGHHSRPTGCALTADVLLAVLKLLDVVESIATARRVHRAYAVAKIGHLVC